MVQSHDRYCDGRIAALQQTIFPILTGRHHFNQDDGPRVNESGRIVRPQGLNIRRLFFCYVKHTSKWGAMTARPALNFGLGRHDSLPQPRSDFIERNAPCSGNFHVQERASVAQTQAVSRNPVFSVEQTRCPGAILWKTCGSRCRKPFFFTLPILTQRLEFCTFTTFT